MPTIMQPGQPSVMSPSHRSIHGFQMEKDANLVSPHQRMQQRRGSIPISNNLTYSYNDNQGSDSLTASDRIIVENMYQAQ